MSARREPDTITTDAVEPDADTPDTITTDANAPDTITTDTSLDPPAGVSDGQDGSEEGQTVLGMTRRTAILGVGGAAVMLGLGSLSFIENDPIVRPPGGQDEDRLVSACIRCERCYEICPRNVIAPTHIEQGLLNMRTPTLNFSTDFCDWCDEANGGDPLCAKTCPTKALELPTGATALDTMLGKAVINTDWCLAYKLIGCRFCFDACPYEAMELDANNRPIVLYDICNGCGACESVCVSLQNASIHEGADEVAIVIRAIDENGEVVPRKTGFPF